MKKSLVAFKNGRKLDPVSMIEWNRLMDAFDDGIKVTVTVEHFKRKRSLSQNNYAHFVIGMIADETGEDINQLKEALKARYGLRESITDREGNEVADENGEVVERLKSTSAYTTTEMTEFIEKIRRWAAEFLNMNIPDADVYRNYNIKTQ